MNSTDRLAAERYAAAYDALSKTNKEASRRSILLREAQAALATQQAVMMSPRIALQTKKEIVKTTFSGEPEVASFLEVLLQAKRYKLLPEITDRVEALLDKRLGILRAQVYAAKELSDSQKKQTQEVLSKRYGGQVEAVFFTTPGLLGGLKIRCCGEQVDGSLQQQLAKLQQELTK